MSRSRQGSRVRRWLAGLGVLSLVVATGVIPAASVAAAEPTDMVLDWNLNAVVALSNPLPTAIPAPPIPGAGQTPPVASQHLAMVQGAVYDAVNAIDGGHQPYLEGLPSAPATASKAAAAATAAHDVLVGLVPALPQVVKDRLDSLYTASLAEITDSADKAAGITIGAAAAAAMLAERADDGRYGSYTFPVGTGIGEWRPTSGINDPFAWVAKVRPFTLKSNSQFRTAGPLDVESAEYAAEFNEVKALGSVSSTARTDAQTQIAKFYSVNPLPFMNRAFRDIAAARGLSITEDARLFAMTSMSSADALIGCWDDKAHWLFWRPVTAIAEAENDGNPATSTEAGWTPLLPTPPYPDHPSGFNCFTAGMMYAGKNFFGTNNVEISFTTPAVTTPSTRTYSHLSAVLRDTIDARIWLGIHFRTPDVQGAWLGKRVANWVAKHYFEPVN
jgi:hypothetical protein